MRPNNITSLYAYTWIVQMQYVAIYISFTTTAILQGYNNKGKLKNGPEGCNWLNFGSDPERILDILSYL